MHYDRRETVHIFRERLQAILNKGQFSQSAFAQRIGIDRSTLSQLLSPNNDRLPRADTVAAMALAGQVSVDWLLGLSQDETSDEAIVGQPLEIAREAWDPANERLTAWHAEAAGYKIRYVPSTLPDLSENRRGDGVRVRPQQGHDHRRSGQYRSVAGWIIQDGPRPTLKPARRFSRSRPLRAAKAYGATCHRTIRHGANNCQQIAEADR